MKEEIFSTIKCDLNRCNQQIDYYLKVVYITLTIYKSVTLSNIVHYSVHENPQRIQLPVREKSRWPRSGGRRTAAAVWGKLLNYISVLCVWSTPAYNLSILSYDLSRLALSRSCIMASRANCRMTWQKI